tara:strand:+ start:247 stop:633 length:387 start_codon:yes stop_codon:yes gene_type:complete
MNDPNLFKLTEKDKIQYKEIIKKIDINLEGEILRFIRPKVDLMISNGKLNSIESELIRKIEELLLILNEYPELNEEEIKKILFAISYFCDQNDEIPDAIPDYGYLDDLAVVQWIVQEVKLSISNFKRA